MSPSEFRRNKDVPFRIPPSEFPRGGIRMSPSEFPFRIPGGIRMSPSEFQIALAPRRNKDVPFRIPRIPLGDVLPPIAAGHDVVNRAVVLDA